MNPPSSRLKRTPPKQSGPVRNSMALPLPPRAVQESGAPRDPVAAAGAAVCGALENGVSTAYALIDEYMRRGQDAARGIFNDPTRRGYMSDERPGFPGGFNSAPPSSSANPFNSANPLSMLTEQWMMAMRFWSQAMSSFVPGGWPPAGMNPFAPQQNTAPPKVSVKVSSSRPVEVTANLYPGLDLLGLTSESLRAEASKAAPIDPAEISRESGMIQVSIKVGAKQPAGRYHGYIRKKADGSVAGELTVVIS
jgi:hypothetical protein